MNCFPPVVSRFELLSALAACGHAVLAPEEVCKLVRTSLSDLMALNTSWDDLRPDAYLRDGGRYRKRRHACFVVDGDAVLPIPQRAHWQPVEYNALHGGLQRWFEPIKPEVLADPAWSPLLCRLASVCSRLKGAQPWFVEAHQFRIDTTNGIGRPTPERAHRDGVDFVVVALINRDAVKGGETRVFDADSPNGIRFTMTEPWTLLMLDDARVIHETTPIQPLEQLGSGHRDTLVLTFRSVGFQGPAAT